MKSRTRNLAAFAAGVVVMLAGVATATNLQEAITPKEPDCGLADEMQKVVNDKVRAIGMTAPDPSKFFSVGSPDSCLGDISLVNIDLSQMIPDPYGVVTAGLTGAFNRIQRAAIEKACGAARNSMGDIIGKWNTAASQVNGTGGRIDAMIDQKIGDESKTVMDKWSLNWNTNSTTPTVTDIVTQSGSKPIPATTAPQAATVPATTQTVQQQAAAAPSQPAPVSTGGSVFN